jgi:hypothetical protein
MLGEQFMVGEEICGAVVSIRYQVSKFYILLFLVIHLNCFVLLLGQAFLFLLLPPPLLWGRGCVPEVRKINA